MKLVPYLFLDSLCNRKISLVKDGGRSQRAAGEDPEVEKLAFQRFDPIILRSFSMSIPWSRPRFLRFLLRAALLNWYLGLLNWYLGGGVILHGKKWKTRMEMAGMGCLYRQPCTGLAPAFSRRVLFHDSGSVCR